MILSGDLLGLGFRQMATLRVELTENGRPVAGATVSFTLVATSANESAAGSTLSAASAVTDATGDAQVDLFAGAATATFRVTAEAENAGPATFYASVGDAGFADLVVQPKHVGPRMASALGSIEVALYPAGIGCAALPPESLPEGGIGRTTTDGASVTFANLSASGSFSVLAFAKTTSGAVTAAGCVDLLVGQLRAGSTPILDLPIVDRPLALAPRYQLTATLDLDQVRGAVVGPGSAWAILSCPRGAAQLVLDCAIDLLDRGDPDDCRITSPGDLASKFQQARGLPNAAGCVGTATSLDGKVMTLLAAPSGSPAAKLAGAAATLVDLLDAVSVDAVLTPHGLFADLQIIALGLESQATRFDELLLPSARPIIAAPVVLGLAGDDLAIGPADLSLRLGPFVAQSFESEAELGNGTAILTALLGDGGSQCAAVSASACADVAEAADCLEQACLDARELIARVLDQPFAALSLPGADLELDGNVLTEGDGIDLVAGSLANGVWSGTFHLAPAGDVHVSGAFEGAAQNL